MSNNSNSASHKERTFVMLKPDAIQRNLIGEVIKRFEMSGLKLVATKLIWAPEGKLLDHYQKDDVWYESKGKKIVENMKERGEEPTKPAIEYGKDIIRALVKYMTSGPVMPMVWEGNEAVAIVKKITGTTEPATSDVGTIRGDYAPDTYKKANEDQRAVRNLLHITDPADGPEEPKREIAIWFTEEELLKYKHISEIMLYDIDFNGSIE